MKLRLPNALRAALAAVATAALPLATTVGTGALALASHAHAAAHPDVSGTVTYTNGDSYTLSDDTTFTGIPADGSAATVDAGGYNVTLEAAAANTMVSEFVNLTNVGNLSLSQGRYKIDELNDFNGVTGSIDICGAQVWFTGVNYTGSNAISQDVTIKASTFSENIASLDYSSLRIGGNVTINGLLTIADKQQADRAAKISFQGSHTLTLAGGIKGTAPLLLGVYDGDNVLAITGSTAEFAGALEFQNFRAGSLTVQAGTTNGLHIGGISGSNGALGLVSGSSTALLTLDVAQGSDYTFSGTIANGYSIVKEGAGSQAFTNTSNTLSGSISVTGGSLTYDGTLQNTDNISLTGSSTLTLGGTVNVTQLINTDAGTLVLKDGIVLNGISGGGIRVAENERLTYEGAASASYATSTDLSLLATNAANVTAQGAIIREFSNVTFENGSTLVLGDGQTLSTAPTIDSDESAMTLEVVAGATATYDAVITHGKGISNVNVLDGATLNITSSPADTRYPIFNRKTGTSTLITVSEGATLNSSTPIFGWNNYDKQSSVEAPTCNNITLENGATWNITSGNMYLNMSTIELSGATIDINSGASLLFERGTNTIKTTDRAKKMSVITGAGTLKLSYGSDAEFDIARSNGFDIDETNTADLQISAQCTTNNIKLIKKGAGVLELTNSNNNYSNGTEVQAGTLRLGGEGGSAGTGAIVVSAGATLELAHTLDCITTNNITLNGNLLLAPGGKETLSGTLSGTLQMVTLSNNSVLGLKGSNTSMTLGISHLTMGTDAGFYLTEGATLTLGNSSSDADRINKLEVYVGGDGSGQLHLHMQNNADWGSHKVVILQDGSSVGSVHIDSGYLAMSTSSNGDLSAEAASTNLRGADLYLANGANLIVTKEDGGDGNMGTIHLAGTTKLDSYRAVSSYTLSNNFVKEGSGTAIFEKINDGALTLSGSVTLDQVKLTKGTLNLTGDLTLSGALTATQGTLTVSGSNTTIGGKLTIGNKDNAAQSADVTFSSGVTINGGILVDRGSLTFANGATLNGTVDLSNGGNALGHIVVSGGTVTNSGVIWSRGADYYIELQDSGKLIHENFEYSVRSGLAEGETTRLYTTENERIWISKDTPSEQKTVISNAAINVLGTDAFTITAGLDNVDIINQAGGAMSFADKDKTIRNLLDYTGKAMTNSAALTVTGTLSLSGTLTNTGTLTFNAANLVLDHGMSGFVTSDGNPAGYSGANGNGYITGSSFVIIDSSSNADNLHINGEFAEDSHLSVSEGKLLYSVSEGNANTYYINNDADYSSVVWRADDHLVWVADGKTLTLDKDFDSTHRIATAFSGWVALGDGVTLTNLGQTPADVDNIKVKTDAHATISGAMGAIEPINTTLESGSSLTVQLDAQNTDALNFGNLTLESGSGLSTARDISATLVAANGGTLTVEPNATAVVNLNNADINLKMSGSGTIELHNDFAEFVSFTSADNDFNGTLKIVVSNKYIKFGNDTKGDMQTFASTAAPNLVLEGGDNTHGIILLNCYAGTNDDATANAMRIGSLASDSDKFIIRGDLGTSGGHRYMAVSQSGNTTFAGVFRNDEARSVGLVMNGSGNLTLTNNNESKAGLYINTGTVTLGGDNGAWAGAISVAAGATLAYAGADKVLASSQTISFTGASTLKVEDNACLTLQKAITANSATLSIGDGGKLVLGTGSSWSGMFEGGDHSTVVIGKTGDTQIGGDTAWANFTGTLDVAMGSVYLGAAASSAGGAAATLGASSVIVRNGASFTTHFNTNTSSSPKDFGAAIYTESGATLGNKDGHANWSGEIHLNMAEGSTIGDTIQYNETGLTTFNFHWDKEVTWSNYIYGSGILDITSGTPNTNARYLILSKYQNQTGAFNGTYRLSGNTTNWTELRLNNMWAAKGAKIDLNSGNVRLTINTQNASEIAGLSGNTGEVYAINANRTLWIQQSDDSTFAGIIKNYGNYTLSITKESSGNLTLTSANTSTGTLTVSAGTVTLGGDNGSWAGNISVSAGATLAYAGADKVLASSQNISFTGAATLKVDDSTTLTLQKAITADDATLSIGNGGKLILGTGGSWSGAYVGGSNATVEIGRTGETQITGTTAWASFEGTLDVAMGSVYLGAIRSGQGGTSATLNASNVIVRDGASFTTNFGAALTAPETFSSAIYAESGATLGNLDGHVNIKGSIHLNVADLSDTSAPTYNAQGSMKMNMYWAKYVVWDALVAGDGVLDIEGGAFDHGNTHRLVLNNNGNTFQGTYRLNGKSETGEGKTFLMELCINQDNAARYATIDITGQEGALANLLVAASNATIAGLEGTLGTVKADGGARKLTIAQTANTEFAGAITDGSDAADVLSIEKSASGTLTLSGENTYTGATTVSDGTLKVTGSITSTSSVAVSGDGELEISGAEGVSVTAGGITAKANSESGTVKNVTLASGSVTGATSGEGTAEDPLHVLGEMSSVSLAFTADTVAEISNVTMTDSVLSGGSVNLGDNVTAVVSYATEALAQASFSGMMFYGDGPSDNQSATATTLNATTVLQNTTATGALTVDVTSGLLTSNAGKTLEWTIMDNVTIGADFKLYLGEILKTIVGNGKPVVTLSSTVNDVITTVTLDSTTVSSAGLIQGEAGALLTGTVGALTLTIDNIPEPTTGTLAVLALAALAARRRRK